MKKIIVGAKRNSGEMPVEGSKVGKKFDNVNLYLADFDDFEAVGFTVKPFDKNGKTNKNLVIKIRTANFREIVGMSVEKFLRVFKEKFMFHKVKIMGSFNDYGEMDVEEIRFSKKDCFQLRDEELAEKAAEEELAKRAAKEAEKKMFADDSEFDDVDDEFEPDEDGDVSDDFDFDLDKETGEVKVTKRSGAGEIS